MASETGPTYHERVQKRIRDAIIRHVSEGDEIRFKVASHGWRSGWYTVAERLTGVEVPEYNHTHAVTHVIRFELCGEIRIDDGGGVIYHTPASRWRIRAIELRDGTIYGETE